jgi:uncharacterized protein YdeI (YjbR/CyaY-like superfamily)
MKSSADLPTLLCESAQDWEAWLDAHHATSPGVRLQIAKKASGQKSVSYDEAVEVALCYGWIDGQGKGLNERFWLQKFTPRRPRSMWSKANTERATRLIESGRMQPAGLKAVEAAKADGRWAAAYDSPSRSEVPEDFQAALDKNSEAKAFFATLNKTNRYAIIFRIQTAKKTETRQARIEKFIAMLNEHKKLYP